MLLSKISRNHQEDTLSDVIWCICKQDEDFANSIISNFIDFSSEFQLIDCVREFTIDHKKRVDITFILRHKKHNKIIYLLIESKITASPNTYKEKYRPKDQLSTYSKFAREKNNKAKLALKYKIPDKCILLCPTDYNKEYKEDAVILFTFEKLLKLLKQSNNSETEGIRKELIKFIEEEFEGTFSNLTKHLQILNNKNELKVIQENLLSLRKAMLEKHKSKSGLWKKDSFSYYFGVGLVNKRLPDKNNLSWISYDFYYEDEVKSPLRIEFPKNRIEKFKFEASCYLNKNKFKTDLLNEFAINENSISFLKYTKCGDDLEKSISDFLKYYSKDSKKQYLQNFNQFMHSGIKFIEKIDIELANEYPTFFNHNLKTDDILLKLEIKKRENGKYNISLIFEPTNTDIEKILRLEIYKKKDLISTSLPLITKKNKIFSLKYNLSQLVGLIEKKVEELYQ